MTIPGILFRPRRLGQGIIKYSLKRRSNSWRDVVFDKSLISQAWNRRIKALRLGFAPPKSVAWLPCWCPRYRRLPKWSQPQECLAFLKRERSIRTFVHGEASADPDGEFTRWVTSKLRRLHLLKANAVTVVLWVSISKSVCPQFGAVVVAGMYACTRRRRGGRWMRRDEGPMTEFWYLQDSDVYTMGQGHPSVHYGIAPRLRFSPGTGDG